MRLVLTLALAARLCAEIGGNETPLHWASYHDDLENAKKLIAAGANVNAVTDLGVTPLWAACQNGSEPMTRLLLGAGANPNLALLAGETPLMVAARGGFAPVVRMLLDKDARVDAKGARGQTALMWAVSQKHPEVVKLLLDHGADTHAQSDKWSKMMAVPPHGYPEYNIQVPHGGDTALMFAARVGDLESAKLLVAAGANVNDADAWGVSALTLAAHSDFRDLAEFLLDKGADPNAAPAGFTALHEAIMRRDERLVAALLDHGADPNAPLKTWTPTRRSSYDYHFEPALVGATPYWLAARFTEPGVMRLLLKHGADPKVVHLSDEVAAKAAFPHKREKTTALLAAMGIGGGSPWVQVKTAEREALALEAARVAVEAGVDLNYEGENGRTALAAARGLKYAKVVKFLEEAGAR